MMMMMTMLMMIRMNIIVMVMIGATPGQLPHDGRHYYGDDDYGDDDYVDDDYDDYHGDGSDKNQINPDRRHTCPTTTLQWSS